MKKSLFYSHSSSAIISRCTQLIVSSLTVRSHLILCAGWPSGQASMLSSESVLSSFFLALASAALFSTYADVTGQDKHVHHSRKTDNYEGA